MLRKKHRHKRKEAKGQKRGQGTKKQRGERFNKTPVKVPPIEEQVVPDGICGPPGAEYCYQVSDGSWTGLTGTRRPIKALVIWPSNVGESKKTVEEVP